MKSAIQQNPVISQAASLSFLKTDDFGLFATDQATVLVENVAPTGVLDTHTALWDWSDTSTSEGTVSEANGFVSKYQRGANVPTGSTEFQFHVANMNFKSTFYDWLVIAGTRAQYKGTGTINGMGDYGFLLTAIDGTPDKFRIKIWDKATEDVIYDNMLGATKGATHFRSALHLRIQPHRSKEARS